MKKRLLLLNGGLLLLALCLFALWRSGILYGHNCGPWIVRDYDVSFEWDKGLRDVRIIDSRTGKLESDPRLYAVASKESASAATQIINWTHLARAEGRFYLSLRGCAEPYLVRWSDPYIQELAQLMGAAESQDTPTMREILAKGVNVNARDFGTRRTALIWAAGDTTKVSPSILAKLTRPPDEHAVEFLLASGADPNAKDVKGETALMRADPFQVKVLLRYGAEVDARDNDGRTALVYAIYVGDDVERVRALVNAYADANIGDKNGWTPLMYAASEGKIEETKLLLAAGADPNARNSAGDTALSILRKKVKLTLADRQIIELLVKAEHKRSRARDG